VPVKGEEKTAHKETRVRMRLRKKVRRGTVAQKKLAEQDCKRKKGEEVLAREWGTTSKGKK